jgi:hypothetical protein
MGNLLARNGVVGIPLLHVNSLSDRQLTDLQCCRLIQNALRLLLRSRECQTTRIVLQERGDQADDTGDMAGEEDCRLNNSSWSAAALSLFLSGK